MRVDGKSVIVTPGVFCSFVIELNGGNSSTWIWSPRSCSSRVFSSVTNVHVTESRYGLPFCQ